MKSGSAIRHTILIIWATITMFPIFWMVATAFKTPKEWSATPPQWFPSSFDLTNFKVLFAPESVSESFRSAVGSTQAVGSSIVDSLVISIGATLFALLVGSLAAYSISRFIANGRIMAFNVLTVRMLPAVVVLIPLLIAFSELRLLDTYRGVVLVEAAIVVPFVVWLMRSFFDDIPKSVEDAALLDGASQAGAFARISLPMAKAGLAVTGLFIFILVWTEFIIGLTLTLNNVVPMPVQLAKFQSATSGQLYGIQAALATLAVIPPTIFGLAIQKYLVTGLTFGAIKR